MKRSSPHKHAFSRSREASSAAKRKGEGTCGSGQASSAANRRGEGKFGSGEASSASSGDEVSSRRSVSSTRSMSSGEEAGRTRRPRKKERRHSVEKHPVALFLDPRPVWKLQQKKISIVKSTAKEKSSASHYTENNPREEGSSSSHHKGTIDTGDVEVSSGIVQRPNQGQQVQHSGGSFDQAASSREDDAQVATEASAAPLIEVVGDGSTGDILKEGCLDDAELPSRSGSVEAQEQASFDEETSALLRGEDNKKKPKPFSGELGKIARDGDEHAGKDLRKMIPLDEDEQHPDKIGVAAIFEDLKRGKVGAGWRVLLDIDTDTISEEASHYFAKLRSDHPDDDCDYLPPYEPHQLTEVYERLALYRIRGYQLSVDQQLTELDDENLKKHYSSSDLFEEGYFEHYEESLEWYFDPKLCKHPGYDDYQRLVLYNNGEYLDWENYHSTLNTYEKDLAYVQYCETLAKKTKWIKDYLAQSTHQWDRVERVVYLQALQTATGFVNVSPNLVLFAFYEYIWSILFDHSKYKDMDGLYFEIWKRVAKLKKDFREALLEIYKENMFPLRAVEIERELEDYQFRAFCMKNNYDAYVAGIDEMASDHKALRDIREALKIMHPKKLDYLDYIQKKVDIAKDIGLIGKVPPRLRGDDNQGRHAEDKSAK